MNRRLSGKTDCVVVAALVLFMLAGCGGDSAPALPPDVDAPTPRAKGLSLSQVTIYQGIQIDLMANGLAIEDPPTPIAGGRASLVRVFVTPDVGFAPRRISARLQLWEGTTKIVDLDSGAMIAGASTDANKASTINFEVPGQHLRPGLRWRASLHEEAGAAVVATGSEARSFFPERGNVASKVLRVGDRLRLTIVPMRYTFDASNRMADTSPAALERIRVLLATLYPAPVVEVTLRAPIDIPREVRGNSTGWSDTLDALQSLRAADGAAPNVYYYGLFQPTATFRDYCVSRRGCVVGLASVPGSAESVGRGGIGVSFPDRADGDNWEFTLAHELGHMHGRGHAPCGLGSMVADRAYPHEGGKIGVWGYDQRDATLIAPTAKTDFMSYCDDSWISDYTYRNLLKRMSALAAAGNALTVSDPSRWHSLRVRPRGLALGRPYTLNELPGGEAVRVERADKNGKAMDSITARFLPYDHIEGGTLFVPAEALDNVGAMSVGRHTLHLGAATTNGTAKE